MWSSSRRAVSYAKTISVAIGLSLLVLIVCDFAFAVFQVYRQEATGFAFSRQGLIEFVIASIVLGWVCGTVWYFVRR